jgi:Protein of unknown function (DUF4236)
MGFRFRRSWGIIPGVRFNLGLKSGSVSFGMRGLHYTIGTRGSRVTVGVPGTGLFWTKKISLGFGLSQPARNQPQPNWPSHPGAQPPQLGQPQTHSPQFGAGVAQPARQRIECFLAVLDERGHRRREERVDLHHDGDVGERYVDLVLATIRLIQTPSSAEKTNAFK